MLLILYSILIYFMFYLKMYYNYWFYIHIIFLILFQACQILCLESYWKKKKKITAIFNLCIHSTIFRSKSNIETRSIFTIHFFLNLVQIFYTFFNECSSDTFLLVKVILIRIGVWVFYNFYPFPWTSSITATGAAYK